MTFQFQPVLARYPAAVAGLAWSPHPAGFSGAAVWRGDLAGRTFDPPASPLVRRALDARPVHVAASTAALTPWADRPVPVQPCLCDVWHDHVLYTGDAVTGLIDYGEVKPDHPAVDLA